MSFLRATSAFALLFSMLVFSGCEIFDGILGESEWPEPIPATAQIYRLRPTDKLIITMYGDSDFGAKEATVDQNGTINLIMIDQVKVAGLTRNEAIAKVTELYGKFYKEPKVGIEIKEYSPRKVLVDGFVGRIGPVYILPEEKLTLLQAIANAGGIQPRGDKTTVKLTRTMPDGATKTWKINLNYIYNGKKDDITLQEDDRIYVEDSTI